MTISQQVSTTTSTITSIPVTNRKIIDGLSHTSADVKSIDNNCKPTVASSVSNRLDHYYSQHPPQLTPILVDPFGAPFYPSDMINMETRGSGVKLYSDIEEEEYTFNEPPTIYYHNMMKRRSSKSKRHSSQTLPVEFSSTTVNGNDLLGISPPRSFDRIVSFFKGDDHSVSGNTNDSMLYGKRTSHASLASFFSTNSTTDDESYTQTKSILPIIVETLRKRRSTASTFPQCAPSNSRTLHVSPSHTDMALLVNSNDHNETISSDQFPSKTRIVKQLRSASASNIHYLDSKPPNVLVISPSSSHLSLVSPIENRIKGAIDFTSNNNLMRPSPEVDSSAIHNLVEESFTESDMDEHGLSFAAETNKVLILNRLREKRQSIVIHPDLLVSPLSRKNSIASVNSMEDHHTTHSASSPSTKTFMGREVIPVTATIQTLIPNQFYVNGLYIMISDTSIVGKPIDLFASYTKYRIQVTLLKPDIAGLHNPQAASFTLQTRFKSMRIMYLELKAAMRNCCSEESIKEWPEFPERDFFDRFNPFIIEKRKAIFNEILHFICLHPKAHCHPIFLKFLGLK